MVTYLSGVYTDHPLRVRAYALKDVGDLVASASSQGPLQPARLAAALAPRQAATAGPGARRIGRFDDLRLLSPPEDEFARVHSGRDPVTGERVVIHSYDLSAAPPGTPAELAMRQAKRESEVVRRYQKSSYLPSMVDSWQALPGFAEEMYFFTLAESAATPIARMKDEASWTARERRSFAERSLRALAEFAATPQPDDEPLVHRTLGPESVRVRADNTPLFSGWRWARVPQAQTVTSGAALEGDGRYVAPEVRLAGLGAATPASDVYSLCATLSDVFAARDEDTSEVRDVLALGLEPDIAKRPRAAELAQLLADGAALGVQPAPSSDIEEIPASRWDEGHAFTWEGDRYRVVAVLGQGAAGRTFKLEQLADKSDDPIGTYVGKAVFNAELGEASLAAYKRLRPHTQHDNLSNVLQCSATWKPHELMALLRWAQGSPLDAWRGQIEFLAEMAGEPRPEAFLLRWLEALCGALDVLHAQGWVHGDVSASNILVDDERVVLIDYDFAGPAGAPSPAMGTALYCSPERRQGAPAQPRDDVYALAASFFHALTDRPPTRVPGLPGLPWTQGEREQFPVISAVLDAAAASDPDARFQTAGEALRRLRAERRQAEEPFAVDLGAPEAQEPEPLRPNVVPRVKDILRAYPGSRFGNAETRGLDTTFAADTYVDTELDRSLPAAIRSGEASLVILCGNAGDGKTALLQHLVSTMGGEPPPSSVRVWEGRVAGRPVKVNLDGAASWNGRSADDLLNDLFAPFLHGPPKDARVHLVAVNDGRLMEWLDHAEALNKEPTALTAQLADALGSEGATLDPHIRLVELNDRSLVGGLRPDEARVSTQFLDTLIERLVGGDEAAAIWRPCRTCTAQARCPMKRSADMMGATDDARVLGQGRLLRQRLTVALQSVHQRNEVHITARELKAALSYILFGLYACEDLHADPGLKLHDPADHAFDPASDKRQGELLRELARLDPALEAHARVDRYLLRRGAPDPAHGAPRFRDEAGRTLPLGPARRRGYFAWSDDQIFAVGGDPHALTLRDGRRSAEFREFPLLAAGRRDDIKRRLCLGLSKLEALPEAAFRHAGVVPVRIVPRTPTETAFWVGKPLARFALEAERFNAAAGLETLHRFLVLSYRPERGTVEQLIVPLELYALLMDLADGVQILDAFSDDVFANLGVFTQRLAQEDERSLRAWNPAEEDVVFALGVEMRDAGQTITLAPEPA